MDNRERVTQREMKALGVKSHWDYLSQRFGVMGEDWRYGHQMLMEGINGRMYDVIAVSLPDGGAREVYFDLGSAEGWPRRMRGDKTADPDEDEEDVPLPSVPEPNPVNLSPSLKALNAALEELGFYGGDGDRERHLIDLAAHAFEAPVNPTFPPEYDCDAVELAVVRYLDHSVTALRTSSPCEVLSWAGEMEQLVCRPAEVVAQRDALRAGRPPVSLHLAYLAAAAADLFPGELALDVGAGTGRLAMWAEYHGGAVLATEPDPRWAGMLVGAVLSVVGTGTPPECVLEPHIRPSVILTSLFASPSDRTGADATDPEAVLAWCLQQLQDGGRLVAVLPRPVGSSQFWDTRSNSCRPLLQVRFPAEWWPALPPAAEPMFLVVEKGGGTAAEVTSVGSLEELLGLIWRLPARVVPASPFFVFDERKLADGKHRGRRTELPSDWLDNECSWIAARRGIGPAEARTVYRRTHQPCTGLEPCPTPTPEEQGGRYTSAAERKRLAEEQVLWLRLSSALDRCIYANEEWVWEEAEALGLTLIRVLSSLDFLDRAPGMGVQRFRSANPEFDLAHLEDADPADTAFGVLRAIAEGC